MSVIASVLVLVSIVLLLVGVSEGSAEAYTAAAATSALAVILLWRFLRVTKDRTFVSEPPPVSVPDWDRPLRGRAPVSDADRLGLTATDVAIDDYDSLMAAEILPSLETLSIEELEAVVGRERRGLQRQGIIARAERLIDLTRRPDVDLSDSSMSPAAAKAPRRRSTTKTRAVQPETPAATPKRQRKQTPEKPNPDISL